MSVDCCVLAVTGIIRDIHHGHEYFVRGMCLGGNTVGRQLLQPFLLRKAILHDHRRDHDDIVAGIIVIGLAKAVPLTSVAAKAAAKQSRTGFVQRTLSEKKESFGIDRSVAVGPTVPQGAHHL
jgi:hypothetical protein